MSNRLLFDRRLRDPRMVPSGPVRVNWDHPLASGLVCTYLPAFLGANLVAPSPYKDALFATAPFFGIGGSPIGLGIVTTNYAALMDLADPGVLSGAAGWSLFWKGFAPASFSSNFRTFVGVIYDAANDVPYYSLSISTDNSGAGIRLWVSNSSSSFNGYALPTLALGAGQVVSFGASVTPSESDGYYNGAVFTTNPAANAVVFSAAPIFAFGAVDYTSVVGHIYARAISADEQARLNETPFCMLESASPVTFWDVGASASSMILPRRPLFGSLRRR